MCQESSIEIVESILPFWPRYYSALSVDLEHRVREGVQVAHASLVKRVGRNIATYLKQIAGVWFTSQFDMYPLAASAATNSFNTTFPERKLTDAIIHCQDEILFYICDNIINQSPQTMNTNKLLTPEELETKYQRVLICSLQGYAYYLKKLPQQEIKKTIDIHKKIISNGKFWKLSKHEVTLVKSGFFNVLTSIIVNTKSLLDDEKKRTITSIMNCLDETEPSVLSAVWECMLVAIDKINDWYLSVSMDKLVLPKLWRVLKNSGQGCANIVYPSLLPLLSQFPKFNIDNKTNCFINFFDNMKYGLTQKTVQISRSELSIIIKSFIECMRYAVLLNNDDTELCCLLLKEQLMPIIDLFLRDYTPIKKNMFIEVSQLIRYWSKNRDNDEYKSYSVLIKLFWNELDEIFKQLIDSTKENYDKNEVSSIFNAQIKLLMSLKNSSVQVKKNLHVKFADCEDDFEPRETIKVTLNDNDDKFNDELVKFVTNVCINYLKDIQNQNRIEYLNQLVSSFESKSLFIEIAKAQENDDNLLQFYNKNLKTWLDNKEIDTNSVVQLTFTLINYMNDNDKNLVLESLSEFNEDKILNLAVISGLADKNRKEPQIKNWLMQRKVTDHLVGISRKIVESQSLEDNSDFINLIILAFGSSNGKISVSQEVIDEIAKILCEKLKNSEEFPDQIVQLVSKLLELTLDHQDSSPGSLKLLKTLFELTLNDNLTPESRKQIRDIWKIGFERISDKLSSVNLLKIQSDCVEIIFNKLYSSTETSIEDLVEIAMEFVESSSSYDYHDALSMTIKFNLSQKIVFEEWIPHVTSLILYGEILSGNFHLANPIRSLPIDKSMTYIVSEDEKIPDKTESSLQWASFNVKLLNKLLMRLNEEDMVEEVDSGVKDCLADLPHIVNSILLIVSLSDLYGNHYKSSKNYDSIKQLNNSLSIDCIELRNRVPKFIWGNVLTESMNLDNFWIEFGSIFSQFLRHFNLDTKHLVEIKTKGPELLASYIAVDNDDNLTLVHHINAVVLARSLVGNGQHDVLCRDVLIKIIKRHQDKKFLLINGETGVDVGNVSWEDFYLPLEVIRLFTRFIKIAPTIMNSTLWDAAIIYLASWQFSLNKSKHHWEDLKVRCFVVAICELFCEVQSLMNRHSVQTINELPSTLLAEWNDVFAEDVHRGVATTWMFYTDLFNEKNDHLMPIVILNYLGNAVKLLDGNLFFKSYSGNSSVGVTSNQLIKFSFKLCSSAVPSLQLSSYYMINRMIPRIVELEKDSMEKENFDSKTLIMSKFEDCLRSMQNIVNAMLTEFKLCDDVSCSIQAYTDSHTYTLGYFLVWANALDICAHSHDDLRYQYAEILKDEYFPSLLNNIFRLMPAEILQKNKCKIPAVHLIDVFKNSPALEFNQRIGDLRIDHIACWLFVNCLRFLPVAARQWWSTLDSRASGAIERITTLYVSPILCQEELLNKRLNDIASMQIKVHPSAREVFAIYQMDDTKLELSMVLPVNYPLGTVAVTPGQNARGAPNFGNCHMQLSKYLTHQVIFLNKKKTER